MRQGHSFSLSPQVPHLIWICLISRNPCLLLCLKNGKKAGAKIGSLKKSLKNWGKRFSSDYFVTPIPISISWNWICIFLSFPFSFKCRSYPFSIFTHLLLFLLYISYNIIYTGIESCFIITVWKSQILKIGEIL